MRFSWESPSARLSLELGRRRVVELGILEPGGRWRTERMAFRTNAEAAERFEALLRMLKGGGRR